jgi:uncharacterized membrane protein
VPRRELEATLLVLSTSSHVHGLATFYGDGVSMCVFKSDERKMQGTLKRLSNIGVGSRFGTIDVTTLVTTLPSIRSKSGGKKKYKIDDRMSVEEIRSAIESQSRLTFDFLAMTCIAAILSGTGLVGDSSTTVVASMLVSPLMGPILCVTFGLASGNSDMIKRGTVNVLCGLLLCICVGFLIGFCTIPYYNNLTLPDDFADFISNSDLAISSEIIERGSPSGLVMGFAVALPSGVGVTLAVTTSSGINALVGVAIAAALIPPVVNAGICVVTGIFLSMMKGETDVGHNFLLLAGVSFALFFINILTMVLVGIATMKLKKVPQQGADTDSAWNNEMFSATGERSSFWRSGVELQTREDLLAMEGERNGNGPSSPGYTSLKGKAAREEDLMKSPLLDYRDSRVSSDPYSGWWGSNVNDDENQGGGKGVAVGAGSTLMSFMLSAGKALGNDNKKNPEGLRSRTNSTEKKRDSIDVFSPNNFEEDLINEMRKSVNSSVWGQEDGGGGGGGEEGEITFNAGEMGQGFRINDDGDDDSSSGSDGEGGGGGRRGGAGQDPNDPLALMR